MHAVCRDAAVCGGAPCLFAQVERPAAPPGDDDDEEDGDEEDEDEVLCTEEVRLVPPDEASLNSLFRTMGDVAALNPEVGGDGDGDEEGGMFFDEDEARAAVMQSVLDRLDARLEHDPSRFADDDEEGEEYGEEEEEEDGADAGGADNHHMDAQP